MHHAQIFWAKFLHYHFQHKIYTVNTILIQCYQEDTYSRTNSIPVRPYHWLNTRITKVHDQYANIKFFQWNCEVVGSTIIFLHFWVAQASSVLSTGVNSCEQSICSENVEVQQLIPIMSQEPTSFSCSLSVKQGSRSLTNDLMEKGQSPRTTGSRNHPRLKSMDLAWACSSRNVFPYGSRPITSNTIPMRPSLPYGTLMWHQQIYRSVYVYIHSIITY